MTAETYYVLKALTVLIFEIFCPLCSPAKTGCNYGGNGGPGGGGGRV